MGGTRRRDRRERVAGARHAPMHTPQSSLLKRLVPIVRRTQGGGGAMRRAPTAAAPRPSASSAPPRADALRTGAPAWRKRRKFASRDPPYPPAP
jgi:hypothetical protein